MPYDRVISTTHPTMRSAWIAVTTQASSFSGDFGEANGRSSNLAMVTKQNQHQKNNNNNNNNKQQQVVLAAQEKCVNMLQSFRTS